MFLLLLRTIKHRIEVSYVKGKFRKLNDVQFDVLKEIRNIGAGNATTALSTMLNVKMDMSVPNVALIQF